MRAVISLDELMRIAKQRNTLNYFIQVRKYKNCFSGEIRNDIQAANLAISAIKNNNTAHAIVSMFNWAFKAFYGIKYNSNFLLKRKAKISKFTTRLSTKEISLIRSKYKEYIASSDITRNAAEWVRNSRITYYWIFESLLCSGMRIG